MPFNLPYQVPTAAYQIPFPSSNSSAIQQYLSSAAAAVPSQPPPPPRLTGQNAWTVEEQIYKSKMWLRQRNKSMMGRH